MAVADPTGDALHRWMQSSAPADGPIGVAVSGGSDSLALMLLLADWARAEGRDLHVATVDHGLRPESADEAMAVARRAGALDLSHTLLTWREAPKGNLQDAARRARTALLADWARSNGLGAVALGHTMDDQAETLLLRLARGSGVDGLSAMAPLVRRAGVLWLRPLLGMRRADLRDWLRKRGEVWIDDPSNDDPRFDRVRLRALMPALEDLGLGVERLAETARHLRRARQALDAATARAAEAGALALDAGAVQISRDTLRGCPEEIRLRLLADALCWVSGQPYRPRLKPLEEVAAALCTDAEVAPRSLHGCLVSGRGATALVSREPSACGDRVPAGAVWDGIWHTSARAPDLQVGALGEAGLAELPDWRASGLPRAVLLASPAFWRGDALIAAPFALPGEDCHVWRVVDWADAVSGGTAR